MNHISHIRNIQPILFLLLLTACNGSDPMEPAEPGQPEEKQTAITFAGTLQEGESVTRAVTGLEEVLTDKKFNVWGYKNDAYTDPEGYTSYQTVMPNFTVNWGANTAYTTTSNTNDWEYVGQGDTPEQRANQTIKYWDWSALAYRFFGVAGGTYTTYEPNGPNGPYRVNPTYEAYEISADVNADDIDAAPYFSELWFSNGNIADYPDKQFGKPVQLRFIKPFARVRFMFTFIEGLSFGRESLRNPEFKPSSTTSKIPTRGKVTASYPLTGTGTTEIWSTSETTGIDAFTIDWYETPDPSLGIIPEDALPTTYPNTPEKWYYVLPVANNVPYTLSVSVVTDEAKTAIVPAEYMNWKPGYEYTYKFKILETGDITLDIIQVAINQWVIKGTDSHAVYNW